MVTTTAEITFQQTESNSIAYDRVGDTQQLVSDEADDLVIALIARERLASRTGDSLTVEESMRALGVDPAEFGL